MSNKPLVSSNGRYDDSMTLLQATNCLREIHDEFPFGDWREEPIMNPFTREVLSDNDGGGIIRQSRSLAVQIAAMLSQFAAACVPRGSNRMGFIYNANSQRSGKTLLAKIAIMLLYGMFKAQTWKTNEEDLAKVVDAEVLAGSTYICFDNVRGYVGSQAIEGLMTTPQWTGRVLGKTQMFTAENRLTLFITGNDCIVSPDMNHRCLTVDLFVAEGNVQERKVKSLIDEVWLQDMINRKRILSALWAIVRHWYAAGSPSATEFGYKTRNGFERWGETIGGMVAFAGFGDCLQPVQLEHAGDSEDRNIRMLVSRLRNDVIEDEKKIKEYRFQDIVNMCHDHDIFDWKLDGSIGEGGDFKLKARANSSFGLLLGKFAPSKAPRSYRLTQGETVYFSNKGEGRDKRYIVEIVRT